MNTVNTMEIMSINSEGQFVKKEQFEDLEKKLKSRDIELAKKTKNLQKIQKKLDQKIESEKTIQGKLKK